MAYNADCALKYEERRRNMLLFLASVLEQLDLALEHIQKGNVHDARFGLMLTDNALELVLHQIAKDKVADLKMWSFKQEE